MDNSGSLDLQAIAQALTVSADQVARAVALLDEGNTIPFITRYRRDQTGGLVESQLLAIKELVARQRALHERKLLVIKSIQSQGKWTEELGERIQRAETARDLEDLYTPFRPVRQTAASLARQRGLEPLADEVVAGQLSPPELAVRARDFVRVDKGLQSVEDVFESVQALLAERFSERVDVKQLLRKFVSEHGQLATRLTGAGKPDEAKPAASAPDETPPAAAPPVAEVAAGNDAGAPISAAGDESETATAAAVPATDEAPASPPAPTATPQTRTSQRARRGDKRRDREPFQEYADYREPLSRNPPPHRVLAINRGERSGHLKVRIDIDLDAAWATIEPLLVSADHPHAEFLRQCAQHALGRHLLPSIEREVRRELTDAAERHAVEVFARNLRNLLLQPPVRGHYILAIDPGFRSGCKAVVLDPFGTPLAHNVFHVVGSEKRRQQGQQRLVDLITNHPVTVIAIGNGAGCRATEQLVSELIANQFADRHIRYVIVNQAGASAYSTSELGREELPSHEPIVRSAISIGRRLLDPLSELVKIEPAHIGVGLYQHDVKAKHLAESLDETVQSCVNYVGVDVNTASPALLRYVSGLSQLTARRIYEYRQQHGPFRNRQQLNQVAGVGEATFVQAAGFLRITDGDQRLDATSIHPESYAIATQMLADLGGSIDDLLPPLTAPQPAALAASAAVSAAAPTQLALPLGESTEPTAPASAAPAECAASRANGAATAAPKSDGESVPRDEHNARRKQLRARLAEVDVDVMAEKMNVGKLLMRDILSAIVKPGRDPRDDIPGPIFRRGILKIEDLTAGMKLRGQVVNVVDFGVFVDIGVGESCLIHISRLSRRFVRDPHWLFAVGDVLDVWVTNIDKARRRVALTAVAPASQQGGGRHRSGARRRTEPAATGAAGPGDRSEGATTAHAPRPRSDARRRAGPSRQRRGPPRRGAAAPPRKPPKPLRPITQEMVQGKEPMRTFGDLMQFFQQRDNPGRSDEKR